MFMKHSEGSFEGISSTKIYYQNWLPDSDIQGVVIVVHGFGEHSGRYLNVVNALVPENYAIWALDHRGHGKSEGKRNHINRFTDYLDDLEIFEQIVLDSFTDKPLFMLGHSMGSIIATHYMASRADQTKYKRLVLSGTGSKLGVSNIVMNTIAKVFSVLIPKLSGPSGIKPKNLSHDEAVVTAYIDDPLVNYKTATSRFGAEFNKYVNEMVQAAGKITIPTLIQVGAEDNTFKHQDKLFDALNSKDGDKEFISYEGFLHEIFNELEKEKALNDLKNWLNKA